MRPDHAAPDNAPPAAGIGPPFDPFLRSLSAYGIDCGLADHRRVHRLLRSEHDWRIEDLRLALGALLAQDRAQRQAFDRAFDEFFRPPMREIDRLLASWRDFLIENAGRFPRSARKRLLRGFAGDGEQRVGADRLREAVTAALAEAKVGAELAGRLDHHLRSVSAEESLPATIAVGAVRELVPLRPWIDRRRLVVALTATAILGYAGYFLWNEVTRPDPGSPTPTPAAVPKADEPLADLPPSGERLYDAAPVIELMESGSNGDPIERVARNADGLAGFLGLASLVWLGFFWWRLRRPVDRPPPVDLSSERRFDPGEVGGERPAWLGGAELDELAERIGTFVPREAGAELDIDATVESTCNAAGSPSLVYRRRRRDRQVVVLEDVYADARRWNPLAGELVAGLRRRRVHVVHGQFHRSPARFYDLERGRRRLSEWSRDDAEGLLLLVFTDGRGLDGRDLSELEPLGGFPYAAWIDLREPRFWDAGAVVGAALGLPVFPASRDGVEQALVHLLPGRVKPQHHSETARRWWGRVLRGGDAAFESEEILAGALPWARACAMHQPLPLALAERLRGRFFADVDAHAIGRFFELTGSRLTVSGLRFAVPMLAELRRGFGDSEEPTRQEEILRFILREIERCRPQGELQDLALLSWKKAYYRTMLELDPDEALPALGELAASPVRAGLESDLAGVVPPGGEMDATAPQHRAESPPIPLRRAPQTRAGKLRLAELLTAGGAWRTGFLTTSVERAVTALLLVATLGAGLLAAMRSGPVATPPMNFRLEIDAAPELRPHAVAILDRLMDGQQGVDPSRPGGVRPLAGEDLFYRLNGGASYRLSLLSGPLAVSEDILEVDQDRAVRLRAVEQSLPCTEALAPGAELSRCPALIGAEWQAPSWRASMAARGPEWIGPTLVSLGVELVRGESEAAEAQSSSTGQRTGTGRIEGRVVASRSSRLAPLRDALLRSSSVDFVVSIAEEAQRPDRNLDLGLPSDTEVQVIWWTNSGEPRPAGIESMSAYVEDLFDLRVSGAARLDQPGNGRWQLDILDLLSRGEAVALDQGPEIGAGVVLLPDTGGPSTVEPSPSSDLDAELSAGVRVAIADVLGLDPDQVTADARLIDDLGADELDVTEIVLRLEKDFAVTFPEAAARDLRTVGDIAALLAKLLAERNVPLPAQSAAPVEQSPEPAAAAAQQQQQQLQPPVQQSAPEEEPPSERASPEPRCDRFVAAPTELRLGQTATLSWSASGADSGRLRVYSRDPEQALDIEVTLPSGQYVVRPRLTRDYALELNGSGQTIRCVARVEVTESQEGGEQPARVLRPPGTADEWRDLLARPDDLDALLYEFPQAASNRVDAEGNQPLHLAARACKTAAVVSLLRAGAVPDARNGAELSALDIARRSCPEGEELLSLLESGLRSGN